MIFYLLGFVKEEGEIPSFPCKDFPLFFPPKMNGLANAFSDLLGGLELPPFSFLLFGGFYRPRNLHRMRGRGGVCSQTAGLIGLTA